MHKNAQLSPRLETVRKPYHTPDDMYLINPSLIAPISRVLRGDAKHLRIGVGDDVAALRAALAGGRRLRFGLVQAVLGWIVQGLMLAAALGILLASRG